MARLRLRVLLCLVSWFLRAFEIGVLGRIMLFKAH
jgi:hypothetical protein